MDATPGAGVCDFGQAQLPAEVSSSAACRHSDMEDNCVQMREWYINTLLWTFLHADAYTDWHSTRVSYIHSIYMHTAKQQQTLASRVIFLWAFVPTNSVPGLNTDIPWFMIDTMVNDSNNHPSEPAGNLGYVFRDGAS